MDANHSYYEYVILGSGIAGLSAANTLVDQGFKPLVIDQNMPGNHRVCGEFFSNESLTLLETWQQLPKYKISQATIHLPKTKVSLQLKKPARSEGHDSFDINLFHRAKQKGLQFLKAQIQEIEKQKNGYQIHLNNGLKIQAKHLFVGFGKKSSKTAKYIGFKAHFRVNSLNDTLDLYPIKGGYIGLCRVGKDYVNIAGIVKAKRFSTIESAVYQNPALAKRLENAQNLFPDWKVVSIGSFGIKKHRHLENYYEIGDGFCSVYPASGLGLSLSLLSGHMAAELATQNRWHKYYKAHRKKAKKTMHYASFLHFFLCRARLTQFLLRFFPRLSEKSYEARYLFKLLDSKDFPVR